MTYVAHRVAHVDGGTPLQNARPSIHTRSTNASNGAGFGADVDVVCEADIRVNCSSRQASARFART